AVFLAAHENVSSDRAGGVGRARILTQALVTPPPRCANAWFRRPFHARAASSLQWRLPFSSPPMLINCVAYENGSKLADIPVAEISDYLARPDCFVWVALKDATEDELKTM